MSDTSELFSASFARALKNDSYNKAFIESFYDKFIATSPQIAAMFKNTNMATQKTMLHDSLNYMVEFYKNPQATTHLQHIQNVHGKSGLNIPQEYYHIWLDSLIETLKIYDPLFDAATEQAWRTVLTRGIQFMQADSQGSSQ